MRVLGYRSTDRLLPGKQTGVLYCTCRLLNHYQDKTSKPFKQALMRKCVRQSQLGTL